MFAGRYEVSYQGELCLCQTAPGAFFLGGNCGPISLFFGGGVTSSDWLVSDLTEAAGSQSIELLLLPVATGFHTRPRFFNPTREGVL